MAALRAPSRSRPAPPPPPLPGSTARERSSDTMRERSSNTMRERQTPQALPAPASALENQQMTDYLAEEQRLLMLLEDHKSKYPALAKVALDPQASSAAPVDRSAPVITPAERAKLVEESKSTQ